MQIREIQSILPLAIFIIPLAWSISILTLGRRYRAFRERFALMGLLATLAVSFLIYPQLIGGEECTALVWHEWFYLDGLSLLMIFVVSVMTILIILYSIPYLSHEASGGSIQEGKLSLYYGLLVLFVGFLNWACVTNSLILLYVTLEASTLSTVYLVAFDEQRRSLEAAYKYVLLISVGVISSLIAALLLYCVSGDGQPLYLSKLGDRVAEIPRTIALVSCGLFMTGFGTKAGLIPFHAWLPDAHAEAPAPISVLLSGVVIKMGAYALARTVAVFAPHFGEVLVLVAILGSVTMILGILLAFTQDDLKRLLAYSSVSEMGFIVLGLGLGTYLGLYGGFFHLVNHTLMKGVLFFCSGALLYAVGSRRISELRVRRKRMRVTGFCFFVAALAIGGVPPFNGFMSSFTIFLALSEAKLLWTAIALFGASFLTAAVMIWAGYRIFWTQPTLGPAFSGRPGPEEAQEVPFLMGVVMLFLAILCILLGAFPQLLYPLLHSAAKGVLSISGVP